MRTITITYDPKNCGLDDEGSNPNGADLFSYLVNELDNRGIKCRIREGGVRARRQAQLVDRKRIYLLKIIGDVEPCVQGPFGSRESRDVVARQHRKNDDQDMQDGLYRAEITSAGALRVTSYGGNELEAK